MPRRSPGQPKIRPKPTASDRARRQRTRKIKTMQAQQIDSETLVREKQVPTVPVIEAGHSGDVSDTNTPVSTPNVTKLSVKNYQEEVQLGQFEVTEAPKFFASDTEMDDIEKVQGTFTDIDCKNHYNPLESVFKTLEETGDKIPPTQSFNISDEEFASDDALTQATLTIATPDQTNSGGSPPIPMPSPTVPELATQPENTPAGPAVPAPNTMPTPTPMDEKVALENAKQKIKIALEVAQKANNPETHIETALHELNEDTTMLTTLSKDQQLQHQVEALKFLCNSLIRNAKLATKMTRVVNTNQVTKAVNKALLMEDLNPVQLNLSQFLQHPFSSEIWMIASHHASDFDKHRAAWGHWWMGIVEDQNPRQRLRRSVQHAKMFNHLAMDTFVNFGQNPTRYSTEWLVIQLVRLGDHLLAANLKSEYGFNWAATYQKTAAFIARNRLVRVPDIFSKLEALWPSGVRMNFHFNQPAYIDCILQLSESVESVGKIPEMKKMKHKHNQIFGSANVADREPDSDTSVNNEDDDNDDREYEPPRKIKPPQPSFPIIKKQKSVMPYEEADDEGDFDPWEPRKPSSYADIFN